ncbi:MAG: holo-ACP synthase [Chloroflexi bacterium]|nr:holo-ACP synthase [Chloroflexota bacterium]
MHAVGVDIVETSRIARAVERWGERFLSRIYTAQELAYCRGRVPQLAARFAAKEAVMKALGTGRRGVGWRDVEVVRVRGGRPTVQLQGRALQVARAFRVAEVALSLSHSRDYAVASVVLSTREVP